jgi:hypothetical protein
MTIPAPVAAIDRDLPLTSPQRRSELVSKPDHSPSLVQRSCDLLDLDTSLGKLSTKLGKSSDIRFIALSEWSCSAHSSLSDR